MVLGVWARASEGEPGLSLLGVPLLLILGWVALSVLSGPRVSIMRLQWGLLISSGIMWEDLCWSLSRRVWSGAGGDLGVPAALYNMPRCARVVWGWLLVVPGMWARASVGEPGLPM